MGLFKAGACVWVALVAVALTPDLTHAQDLLDQDWLLNPRLSNIYMQTVKANALFETHEFTAVEGTVSGTGEATVRIELASLATGIDVRDVRMRFLLFEVFKFPHAEIKAKLDKAALRALTSETRIDYPLSLSLKMHGIMSEIKTRVWVTRISDTTVSVATIQPIIVTAESFGLAKNVEKLAEAAGGILIAPAASITFDLVFGTGQLTSGLEKARLEREAQRAAEAAAAISAEACENRFAVISKTGAIYFKTGSAELDLDSAPLLASVADIAKRCPSVKFDVEGHTDSIDVKGTNQQLSEQRAKSVADDLIAKGVSATRIRSAGLGATRPVAPNDTEAGRAKNRRIEFKVR